MKPEKPKKTLLQRVQSRISTRRNYIRGLEGRLDEHYWCKGEGWLCGGGVLKPFVLAQMKETLLEAAESQRLDKEIFQMLLRVEADGKLACSMAEGYNRGERREARLREREMGMRWKSKYAPVGRGVGSL